MVYTRYCSICKDEKNINSEEKIIEHILIFLLIQDLCTESLNVVNKDKLSTLKEILHLFLMLTLSIIFGTTFYLINTFKNKYMSQAYNFLPMGNTVF